MADVLDIDNAEEFEDDDGKLHLLWALLVARF